MFLVREGRKKVGERDALMPFVRRLTMICAEHSVVVGGKMKIKLRFLIRRGAPKLQRTCHLHESYLKPKRESEAVVNGRPHPDGEWQLKLLHNLLSLGEIFASAFLMCDILWNVERASEANQRQNTAKKKKESSRRKAKAKGIMCWMEQLSRALRRNEIFISFYGRAKAEKVLAKSIKP